MWAKRVSYKDYRGRIKLVSLLFWDTLNAEDTAARVSPSTMKVHSGNVRSKPNTPAQPLHLDEVKRADTFSFPNWRERATTE